MNMNLPSCVSNTYKFHSLTDDLNLLGEIMSAFSWRYR